MESIFGNESQMSACASTKSGTPPPRRESPERIRSDKSEGERSRSRSPSTMRVSSKRTHSDNSEEEEAVRSQRKKASTKRVDVVLKDTFHVFAKFNQSLDQYVKVFQSDLDAFKDFKHELKENLHVDVPGYVGSDEQIIRLLHLYKYKRSCRQEYMANILIKNMKSHTFQCSWNAMIFVVFPLLEIIKPQQLVVSTTSETTVLFSL
jgi:hypothetical protein